MQFSEIKISEIFPNPDGTDTGNEWIELMNTGETAINLANWSIENEKNSQTLSGEIAPQSTKTIQNLKFSLRNSDETIYLKSPDSQIIHQLSYDKAPSGQSYSRITIQKGKDQKSSYDWVSPSKNWPNPIFHELHGIVSTPPQIASDFYFKITNDDSQTERIIFKDDFELLNSLIKPGADISILASKPQQNYELLEYKINSYPEIHQPEHVPTQTDSLPLWTVFMLVFAMISSLGLVLKPKKASSLS